MNFNLAPNYQWEFHFRGRWRTVSYIGRTELLLLLSFGEDLTAVLGRGFAISRPEMISPFLFFGGGPAIPDEFGRRRLPNVVVILDVKGWSFFTLDCKFAFFVAFGFMRSIVVLMTFPFLTCALTFFLEILVIRP